MTKQETKEKFKELALKRYGSLPNELNDDQLGDIAFDLLEFYTHESIQAKVDTLLKSTSLKIL